ncbi:hypothetical protein JG688_00011448 [Phytophthora aleatoria]|uniref:Uncharacterized protein n=1 Tax=Phytophthora aleatoria TaxID=2496075 RepID=A0A8J5M2Q3_9STRA|nr:hypothetical protein JG688_00011448 [Phytophthora aleatoria]
MMARWRVLPSHTGVCGTLGSIKRVRNLSSLWGSIVLAFFFLDRSSELGGGGSTQRRLYRRSIQLWVTRRCALA